MLKQVASHLTGRRRCHHRPRRRPVVARSSSYPLAGSVPGLPASVSLDICTLLLTLQSATRPPRGRYEVSNIGALDRPRPPPASFHIRTDLALGKSGRFPSEQVDSLLWNEWTILSEYAGCQMRPVWGLLHTFFFCLVYLKDAPPRNRTSLSYPTIFHSKCPDFLVSV
jgi:hypothetical protein